MQITCYKFYFYEAEARVSNYIVLAFTLGLFVKFHILSDLKII